MKKNLLAMILVLCPFIYGEDNAAVKTMVDSAKKMRDKKAAVTLLEQALKIDGTYFEAHYELCKLYRASYGRTYKKEAKKEARKKLREVLRNAHKVGMGMPDKKRDRTFNKQLDEIIKMREKYDKAASEVHRQTNMWAAEAYRLKKIGDEDWKIYMEAAKKLGFKTEEKSELDKGEAISLTGKWSYKYIKTGWSTIVEFDKTGEILSGTSIRLEKVEGTKLYYRAPNMKNRGFVINLNDVRDTFSVQEYKNGKIIFEKIR